VAIAATHTPQLMLLLLLLLPVMPSRLE